MFLPTTLKEVRARGWDQLDVILFTGDAYIDHPSFGAAVVGRLLEAEGYRVAIVPQPNWRDDLRDFTKLGTPRLFFGVTAGAMDSMVNHYTANIRLRSNDAYTPGGKAGFRPDYAVKTYTQILKRLFPRTPVVIGGIEASLRRLTHYDYWSDSLHPSILADSGADLLIYGMGERVIQQVARAMNNGFNAKLLRNIRQVGFMADRSYVERLDPTRTIRLHSYEECVADKRAFGKNFTRIETLSNLMEPDETLVEGVGDRYAVITPPNATLTTEELDHSFDLPYERAPHPRYRGRGDIPAWEIVPGTPYERAILGEVDKTTPEYRTFYQKICAGAAAHIKKRIGKERQNVKEPITEINKESFWDLIHEAKNVCGQDMDAMLAYLKDRLVSMGPTQAQNFHDIIHAYEDLADKFGLWDAAGIMKEYGCSDDGFIDFRAWLIAQGREVYFAALIIRECVWNVVDFL